MSGTRTAVGTALAVATGAYLAIGRRRVLDWGATAAEAGCTIPGDDIVPHPAVQTTRAISIAAPPEFVWPWLVQMGPSPRAGVYTYDWLERRLGIDIRNANRILPEFQHLDPGEFFALNKSGQGLTVREVDPGRSLVLQWSEGGASWAFELVPDGRGCRLLSRNRIPGSGWRFWLGMVALMEPGSLVMERKMLTGIRDRAERYTPRSSVAV